MKIFYVHHAMRKSNNPPTQEDGITNIGKQNAKLVSDLFSEFKMNGGNLVAIYTSPYYRCKETVKIINKSLNLPVIEDDRLNEFVSVHQALKYNLPKNESETWLDCQNRIIACVKDIVFSHEEDEVVICVTSGVNITAFISLAFGH